MSENWEDAAENWIDENWIDDNAISNNVISNNIICNNVICPKINNLQQQEIEQSNQQSVHDLFTNSRIAESTQKQKQNQNKILKTANDYSNFAKDCSRIITLNKSTSNNVLCFVKTLIQELNIPNEQIEHLFSKPTIFSNKKSFTQKKKEIINHAEIFGEAEDEYDDEYLHLEDRYA